MHRVAELAAEEPIFLPPKSDSFPNSRNSGYHSSLFKVIFKIKSKAEKRGDKAVTLEKGQFFLEFWYIFNSFLQMKQSDVFYNSEQIDAVTIGSKHQQGDILRARTLP